MSAFVLAALDRNEAPYVEIRTSFLRRRFPPR